MYFGFKLQKYPHNEMLESKVLFAFSNNRYLKKFAETKKIQSFIKDNGVFQQL